MDNNRRFIIADNQDITFEGLKSLIGNIFPHSIVLRAGNKRQLIELLTTNTGAVVVLDYAQFDFLSVDDFLIICERFPLCDWLLFSDELSIRLIRLTIFSIFSVGIVLKNSSIVEIEESLLRAYSHNQYICKSVSTMLASEKNLDPPKLTLTTTEREILKLLANGHTTKEIAEKRFLSVHTVTTHRKNIFRKIDVNNIHEATRYAVRMGLVDMAEYYI